jgi:hypothetical protein
MKKIEYKPTGYPSDLTDAQNILTFLDKIINFKGDMLV